MDGFFDFLGNYWWLVFPFGGFIWAGIGGLGHYLERGRRERHEMRMERLRLRHQVTSGVAAPAAGVPQSPTPDALARDLDRVVARHDAVLRRWLDHELDAAKVIDYPLMTDMREPLTRDFHRAKRRADALRPDDGEQLDATRLAEYRDAVEQFEDAFEVALAEARRRKQQDFTDAERKRLQTARMLVGIAVDEAASAAERQSAYRRARAELDGLIVLPDATAADIEQRIAGAIDRGTTTA
ncbi:hypothetical protein [Agrococcus sp. SGAir0287]|uniref:hypothetical protein n=1 Tax=Agrococcus sp. SGAir0287 TaxID=2070347 RepID=UPI0010CCC95C|nr:hypothetical protein [Agrococcus sp. SGAir0287]QCR18828.1 hypothetical protein C1N71_04670 [Agrococcus sp. SGAir0287]